MWLQTLTIPQVAALVLHYFRADTQLSQSLAEHFSEVHLAFYYNKREIEMRCMTQFREVVENCVQVHGSLSTSDHAALTLILEKKMPLNGAITTKYKEYKCVHPHDVDDWELAMRRFFSQVNVVRQLQSHVAAFGDPNDIYCHPARQNSYGLSLTTNPKSLLVGAALPSLPPLNCQQHHSLSVTRVDTGTMCSKVVHTGGWWIRTLTIMSRGTIPTWVARGHSMVTRPTLYTTASLVWVALRFRYRVVKLTSQTTY